LKVYIESNVLSHVVKGCSGYNWFWLHGVRYRKGKTFTQAKQWNRRTWGYEANRIGKTACRCARAFKREAGETVQAAQIARLKVAGEYCQGRTGS
jgi:hypothetical protein